MSHIFMVYRYVLLSFLLLLLLMPINQYSSLNCCRNDCIPFWLFFLSISVMVRLPTTHCNRHILPILIGSGHTTITNCQWFIFAHLANHMETFGNEWRTLQWKAFTHACMKKIGKNFLLFWVLVCRCRLWLFAHVGSPQTTCADHSQPT